MNCPICGKKVPFGLEMHMMAAHGARSAEYQAKSKALEKNMNIDIKSSGKGRRRRKSAPKKLKLKYPTRSKLS